MSTMKVAGYGRDVWVKGDRGQLHPSNTDLPALDNVRVYRDGSLGPRPRWTYDSQTNGLNINARIWPARYRYGNGYGPGVDGFVAVNEAELYFYKWGDAVNRPYAEYTGATAPGVAVGSRYVQVDDTRWIVEDKLIDLSGPVGSPKTISLTDVNTTLDAAFAGGGTIPVEGATQHLGRTFYWGSILTGGTTYSARNRLWYSDAYAPNTFTSSTQYLDFDGGTIEGAVSVGNNLFVWTSGAEWFVIQGRGNPANATVSLIGPGRRPLLGRPPARLDNSAVFFSSDLIALIVLTEDGTMDEVTLAHLGARSASPAFAALGAQAWYGPVGDGEINALILPKENMTARSMHNGVWVSETWALTPSSTYEDSEQVGICPQGNAELLAIYDDADVDWNVYIRDAEIDEPQVAGTANDEVVQCAVYLPRLSEPDADIRVRKITIDCRTFSDTDPLPDLDVFGYDGNNGFTVFTIGPNSTSLADVGSGEESHQFIFTSEPLSFSHFTDIRIAFKNIVIENVWVEYETTQEPIV